MITKIKAPKGFQFKITPGPAYTTVQLFDKNKKVPDATGKMVPYAYAVGNVNLHKDTFSDNFWRTHASLNAEYHNKGLGTLLYARAIQWCLEHGYRVSSSGRSSEMARRMWKSKSIRKFFRIKQAKTKLGKQYPTYGDIYDRWYAYEK
jgi:GNAT superfamily N-acetyltransferase